MSVIRTGRRRDCLDGLPRRTEKIDVLALHRKVETDRDISSRWDAHHTLLAGSKLRRKLQ